MTVITEPVAEERAVVFPDSPCLLVHYAPGVLAVLRRDPCPGRLSGWSAVPKHGPVCGCHGSRIREVVVKVSGLRPGDEVLTGCYLPRRQEVLF